jgi:hypothetical protein
MDGNERRPSELEEARAKIRAGLEQCRNMVADYRSTIADGGTKRAKPTSSRSTDSHPIGSRKATAKPKC